MEHKITVIKNPSKKAVEFVEYLQKRKQERKKNDFNFDLDEIDDLLKHDSQKKQN